MKGRKMAVLDDYWHIAEDAADWSLLREVSVDFFHDTLIDPDAIIQRLHSYEILVTTRERTRFPAQVLEGLTNLRLISGTGTGQANVDMRKANELGITVCTTSGSRGRGNTTAELTWALILGITRHIAWEDRHIRQGKWQERQADGLGGKKLGILGMGRLGTIVAGYGNHFDMDVIAWGPTLNASRAAEHGVEYVSWERLFEEADILSIHVPLTELSRGWITGRELSMMKPGAFLVNTSRGPIINKAALVHALQTGQIAGAALDVYDIEPLPVNDPLLKLDNVLLTPHLGYSTVNTIQGFMRLSLENVRAWLAGVPQNVLIL